MYKMNQKTRTITIPLLITIFFLQGILLVSAEESLGKPTYMVDNDFLCKSSEILECCGAGSCLGGEYSISNSMGDGPEKLHGSIYYCSSDGDWTTDLDNKDQQSCEAYEFSWTGSKCCSEADDPNEYYNDIEDGCWNKKYVISGEFPNNDSHDVINYHGSFYGCKLDATYFIEGNEDLLQIKDYHTGEQLIDNKDYCEVIAEDAYYCSFEEVWKENNISPQLHLSKPAWTDNSKKKNFQCCALDQCYNGDSCIENQEFDATSEDYNGYRCINGEWKTAVLVSNIDGTEWGYCPEIGQCLVELQGNDSGAPYCIDSGDYIGNDYCEYTLWTTRTKLLAAHMISIPQGDYTLFCGPYQNTLNFLLYNVKDNTLAKDYVVEKTNDYCILKAGNQIIFGTSLNQDINAPELPFKDIVNTECSSVVTEDGKFHQCSSNRAWYNKKQGLIIYSQNPITVSSSSDLSKFNQEIATKSRSLLNKFKSELVYDSTIFDKGFKKFTNLYISKHNGKEITGYMEGNQIKSLVVDYNSFSTDICSYTESYNVFKNPVDGSSIYCKKNQDSKTVFVQGSLFTTINPDSIWQDFTSKLRLP